MKITRHTLPNVLMALGRLFRNLFGRQPVFVSEQVQRKRIGLCAACPKLSGGQCIECTCFVDVKTLLTTEKCPLGKW